MKRSLTILVLAMLAFSGGAMAADGSWYVAKDPHTGKQVVGSVVPTKFVLVNNTSTSTYSITGTATYTATCTTTGTSTGTCTATQPAVTVTVTSSGVDTDTLTNYVLTSAIEGTGTGTSMSSSKIVHAADDRLSNARTPTGNITSAGAVKLYSGTETSSSTSVALSSTPRIEVSGVTEAMLSLTDVTVANVGTDTHGFCPKRSGSISDVLHGDGSWQPTAGGSISWTIDYEVDLKGLTNQDLRSGGDGQKTLSDGHYVRVINTANTDTLSVVNGSGIYINNSTADTSTFAAAPAIYWRFEELGIDALRRRNWIIARIAIIGAPTHTPATTAEYVHVGGFIGQTTGPSVSGVMTFVYDRSLMFRFGSEIYYISSPSPAVKEGNFSVVQASSTGFASRGGDTAWTVSGAPKDLWVMTISGSRITVGLGVSDSGDFPADIDNAVENVGTGYLYTGTTYNTAWDTVAAWVAVLSGTTGAQDFTVQQIQFAHK